MPMNARSMLNSMHGTAQAGLRPLNPGLQDGTLRQEVKHHALDAV